MKKYAAFLALILFVSTSFSSCAKSGGASQPTSEPPITVTPAVSQPVYKEIVIHLEDNVAVIDPQIASDRTALEIIAASIEGLFTLDSFGNPILAMAESFEKSSDGKTYTFKLRDAQWTNLKPVRAQDFVFAWRRTLDKKLSSRSAILMADAGIKNADAIIKGDMPPDQLGITAVDDKTLKIELSTPSDFFESMLALPVFSPANQEFVNQCGESYASDANTIIANGPFKIISYKPDSSEIMLKKNENYWNSKNVKLDSITYKIIKDNKQAVTDFQNGKLGIVSLTGDQNEGLRSEPQYSSIPQGDIGFILPNLHAVGLQNLNLRLAIALSIDKTALVSGVLKDGSIPADFAVPIGLSVGDDPKDFRELSENFLLTDKDAAKKFFDSAKKDLGVENFAFTLLVEDTDSAKNTAKFIQEQLQQNLIGFSLNIDVAPKNECHSRLISGAFELALTSRSGNFPSPLSYLDSWTIGNISNYGFWANPQFDEIINSILASPQKHSSENLQHFASAEKILLEDAALFPLYQKNSALLIDLAISGIDFHFLGVPRIYKNADRK